MAPVITDMYDDFSQLSTRKFGKKVSEMKCGK